MTDETEVPVIDELEQNVLVVCSSHSATFFEVALAIHELQLLDRSWAARLVGKVDLSRRRLYDLVDVAQLISRFKISKDEALSVGVTKLIKIARHAFEHDDLSAHDAREMLKIARETKVTRLAKVLEGQNPRETKAFVFHLTMGEAGHLKETLVHFGAKRSPNGGVIGKERALRRWLREYWKDEE